MSVPDCFFWTFYVPRKEECISLTGTTAVYFVCFLDPLDTHFGIRDPIYIDSSTGTTLGTTFEDKFKLNNGCM